MARGSTFFVKGGSGSVEVSFDDATEQQDGFMSAADKTLLDGLTGGGLPAFNVTQFGASTSNTGTQNAVAFQAALNFAAASATTKAVYVPPGTWNCDQITDTSSGRTEIYGVSGTVINPTTPTWLKVAPVAGKTGGTLVHDFVFTPQSGNVAVMQPIVWLHGSAVGGIIFVEVYNLTFNAVASRAAPTYFDCIRMDAVFEGHVHDIWGQNLFGCRGIIYEANGFNSGNVHIDSTSLKNVAVDVLISGAGDVVSNLLNTVLLSNIKTVRTTVSGGGQDNAPYQTITLTAGVSPGDTTITVSPSDATNVQTNLTANNPQWVVLDDVNGFSDVHPILAANTSTGVLTLGGTARYAVANTTVLGVGTFGIVLAQDARGIQMNSCHAEQTGVALYCCGPQQCSTWNPIFGAGLKRGVVATNNAQDIKAIYPIYSKANTTITLFEVVAQGTNLKCTLLEPAGFASGGGPGAFLTDNQTPANSLNNLFVPVFGALVPRTVTLNPVDPVAANRPKANAQGEVVQYSSDNQYYICTGFFTNPNWSKLFASSTTATTTLNAQHVIGAGTAPACNVGAVAQLGTGPAAALAGFDSAGAITFTPGTTPSAMAANTAYNVATIVFNVAYGTAPTSITVTPGNNAAAALLTAAASSICFFVDKSTIATNQWVLRMISAGTPTIGAGPYIFYYQVNG